MLRSLNRRHWTLILLAIIILLFFIFVLPVSIPLLTAFITALFLNPLIRMIEKRLHLNRKISVIIVYLTFLILLSFIGTYAVTNIIKQLVDLAENAPDYILQVNKLLLQWSGELERIMEDLPNEFVQEVNNSINSSVESVTDILRTHFRVERLASIVAVIPNYIVSFIVYLIALFLFMLELPILKAKFYHNFTEHTAEKIQFMSARLKYVFVGFLKAQFLVSLIILTVTLLGLFIIIPEYAVIMATIIWLIDLIPIIGSIAILGPWSLYMFIAGNIFMGTQLALLAFILLAIRRTVEPKVMGQQIGLSPLATLIAMYVGLQLIGILGFILGPIVVIAFNSAKEAGIIKWHVKL
ncbi:sporulation integral membrane protein YtvI [Amphibacillus cookii]|uniref:sporulation integral membrane protein YtvI n=1 Tax=Amphibacillus cookii TaxID=767787 RepID=UPI0019579789|nr:sporulation integral membrane protein YtvI [Amphibacillus cookii]